MFTDVLIGVIFRIEQKIGNKRYKICMRIMFFETISEFRRFTSHYHASSKY